MSGIGGRAVRGSQAVAGAVSRLLRFCLAAEDPCALTLDVGDCLVQVRLYRDDGRPPWGDPKAIHVTVLMRDPADAAEAIELRKAVACVIANAAVEGRVERVRYRHAYPCLNWECSKV